MKEKDEKKEKSNKIINNQFNKLVYLIVKKDFLEKQIKLNQDEINKVDIMIKIYKNHLKRLTE